MRIAEIIAIGSELLLGGRQDSNSVLLADKLAAVGVEVRFKTVVGDDEADIVAVLRTAASRADVLVLTGGLGPTSDDRTRQAVARATGRSLRRHPEALAGMRQRLAAWGRTPTSAQLRQALIPSGAQVLGNPMGTAPGFCLKWKGCVLYALPGVTLEAELMVDQEVVPRLVAESRGGEILERRLLHTFGLPEPEVDHTLKGLVRGGGPVRLGLLASPLGVTVSLTASRKVARKPASTNKALDRLVQTLRTRLGLALYAEGQDTMEEVVGRLLVARSLTLAVAESCTGGLIGHRLTEVPGSSSYVDRVAVCYSNRAKIDLLGVPESLIQQHGAVSAEVAAAMAAGVRRHSGTSLGLSVTGIAGPAGATPGKPVGLVYVGLDWALPSNISADSSAESSRGPFSDKPAGTLTREWCLHGERTVIKLRASQAALALLYRWLRDPAAVEAS